MTANDAEKLRPKRPIYKTYTEIIRTIFSETAARIRSTPNPPLAPPTPTARQRIWARHLHYHRTRIRQIEAALRKVDLQVDDDDATLHWTYSYQNRHSEKPSEKKRARIESLRQLKIRATLDTLDMEPKAAKAYFLKLQKELAKI